MPLNEADTCRTYVLPKLYSAGWEDTQISEQKSFTDGRIMLAGKLFFNIIDYTGSATRLFADPDFDGDPVLITEEEMDATGETVPLHLS